MQRRNFIKVTCSGALALGFPCFGKPAPAARPNICFLLADDLRPDGLGALGNPIVKTPNLDQLVKQGFIFRRAYTQGSLVGAVCLPSRTMIMTGVSFLRTPGNTPTLAQTIKAAGYASIRSGKFGNNPTPLDKIFDQHVNGKIAEGNANNLIAFIREHAGRQPLFLYCASHEPHDPQYAPEEFYRMYKPENMPLPENFLPVHPFDNGEMTVRDETTLPWPRTREDVTGKLARYAASTSYFDHHVGRIIAALKTAGQFENTLFIIAGDNGLSLGEHGLLGKQNLYEFGGMHVPLVFAGVGVPQGESTAFAYLMDVYPTLCELAGIAVPEGLDARSQAPVIRGKTSAVRDWMFTAYRQGQRAVRDDRWKLIRYPLINKTQLFDLQHDPHERHDLAADPQFGGKINELMAKLAALQAFYGDNAPLTVPDPQPAAWSPPSGAPTNTNEKQKKKKRS